MLAVDSVLHSGAGSELRLLRKQAMQVDYPSLPRSSSRCLTDTHATAASKLCRWHAASALIKTGTQARCHHVAAGIL